VYQAKSSTATDTTTKLKVGGKPALKKGSVMDVERPGNQPSQPTGGDVVTHMVCAKCQMLSGNSSLKNSGDPVSVTGDRLAADSASGADPAQAHIPIVGGAGADMAATRAARLRRPLGKRKTSARPKGPRQRVRPRALRRTSARPLAIRSTWPRVRWSTMPLIWSCPG
jgi:hypothetical protein